MPAFADGVTTLLSTYDNCLELLKSFKRRSKTTPTGERDPGAVAVAAAQSRLRRSIRKDRARVSRAYDSRLSESGSLLEKGDSRACSSLKRVLRRLKAALTQVLRTATGAPDAVIDYESLVTLSNSSRIDAIKAIDGLSRRISEPTLATKRHSTKSQKSVTSKSSNKSLASSDLSGSDKSSNRKKGKKKKREAKSSGNSPHQDYGCHTFAPGGGSGGGGGGVAIGVRPQTRTNEVNTSENPPAVALAASGSSIPQIPKIQLPPTPPQSPLLQPQQKPGPSKPYESREHSLQDGSRLKPLPSRGKLSPNSHKRFSIASFSSDSTRLGEVAVRSGIDTVVDEDQNIHPVYPLRPLTQPPAPRRRGFWARLSGRS